MLGRNPSNYHIEYMDVFQHWCADSERYAGGDALITAITLGWEMDSTIYMDYKWFGGNRRVRLYHFQLTRGGETMVMPVVHTPFVNRLIRQMQLIIEPFEPGKLVRQKIEQAERR